MTGRPAARMPATASLRGVAGPLLQTPGGHLAFVWIGAIALLLFGPVRYAELPRPQTWLFVAACLVAFSVGAALATRVAVAAWHRSRDVAVPANGRLETVVRVAALVGLAGALLIAIDKLILSGLDFSQGVTAIRFQRAAAVDSATAGELPRSPLLYIGYLTFCFSVAAYLLSLTRGESLRRSTVLLAFIGLAAPFTYSYVYGGRSPLFLVLGMAGGAMAVRVLTRRSPLPMGWMAPTLFAAFLGLTFVYSNWILAERFAATGAGRYSDLETRFETTYDASIVAIATSAPSVTPNATVGATSRPAATATQVAGTSPVPTAAGASPVPTASGSSPAPTVAGSTPTPVATLEPSLSEQVAMHAVFNSYYFSHELPMLDRTLGYEGALGPYFGAYQFYLGAAFIERIVPAFDIDATMLPQLRAANVYGWFSTAWGGMYLDFGLLGAIVGALICGWLTGRIYRQALVGRRDGAQLLMCYAIAGILATPILSIFTISVSLLILFALIVTAFALEPFRLWPARQRLARSATPSTS